MQEFMRAILVRAGFVLLALAITTAIFSCGSNSSSKPFAPSSPGTAGNTPTSSPPPPGSPPGSGGSQSAALLVFVGASPQNATTNAEPISGFAVNPDGSAQATPNSPFSGPGIGLAAAPNGQFLFGSDYNNVASYSVASDGSLNQVNNLPGTFGPNLDIDLGGHTLYALESYIGGTGNNDIGVLNIGRNGALQKIGATAISVETGRLYFTPDDTRAYQPYCYHLDASIIGYTRNSDGTLTEFSTKTQLPVDTGGEATLCPTGLAVTPDGKYLVATLVSVLNTIAGFFDVFSINGNGTLTPLPGSPSPMPVQARYVVIDPSGKFLVTAESDGVAAYQFTPGSAPVLMSGSPGGGTAMDQVKFNHAGTLVMATSSAAGQLFVFNFSSGALAAAPQSPHSLASPGGNLAVVER